MSSKEQEQTKIELTIFRSFAPVCPLPIKIDSIEKREAPDISCEIEDQGPCYFELTEIIDQGKAASAMGNKREATCNQAPELNIYDALYDKLDKCHGLAHPVHLLGYGDLVKPPVKRLKKEDRIHLEDKIRDSHFESFWIFHHTNSEILLHF